MKSKSNEVVAMEVMISNLKQKKLRSKEVEKAVGIFKNTYCKMYDVDNELFADLKQDLAELILKKKFYLLCNLPTSFYVKCLKNLLLEHFEKNKQYSAYIDDEDNCNVTAAVVDFKIHCNNLYLNADAEIIYKEKIKARLKKLRLTKLLNDCKFSKQQLKIVKLMISNKTSNKAIAKSLDIKTSNLSIQLKEIKSKMISQLSK